MIVTPAMLNAIASGSYGISWLLYVKAKNRTTGSFEEIGIHTGLDQLVVTIDGAGRPYEGVGGIIEVPSIKFSTGLSVETYDFSLAINSPEVTNMIRAYDSRLATADVHLAVFNSDGSLAGIAPAIRGWIDTINISDSAEEASVRIGIVSNIRAGTKALPLMKSHENQLLRDPTDMGFQYAALTPKAKVPWGAGEGWQNKAFKRYNRKGI